MLEVTRGATGDVLVGALADVLATPLPDPMAREHVVVHSHGIERWISQHLGLRLGATGRADGVCANVAFPSPSDVVAEVMRAAGADPVAVRAWQPASLTWRLLDLVDRGLPPAARPLAARTEAAGDRRLVPLGLLAQQLHRYAVHRPDMVLDWLDGGRGDGAGGTLDDADAWQAEVVRLLAAHIDRPAFPQQVVDTVAALDGGAPTPPGLHRLALFGFTAIPSTQLAVLAALARRIDVHLLLLHPSAADWAAVQSVTGTIDARGLPILPARRDVVLPDPRNRLLRAWGRDVRELQVVVQTVADGTRDVDADTADTLPMRPTILQRLQRAVRTDSPLDGVTGTVDPDQSVQLHACPGRARQVQVLRDEILRVMAADSTIRPRDIIVMCPDVEAFAPLVAAHLAGGGSAADDRPDLRVRLADRSLRQTNPILRLLDEVLDLAATRVTASRLLDLLAADPVRRRFGFDTDDLEDIGTWLERAGVRWGVDAAERSRFGLDGVRHNTLDEGLDRLLLGVAMADEGNRTLEGITPYDDIEGTGVRTVGRLAEVGNRLAALLPQLRTPRPVDAWVDLLGDTVDQLGLASRDEPWQRTELTALLRDLADSADGLPTDVALGEVRDLLADRLRGRPSRANHMTGDLTVCTLVPMRSVPHRVVCLLGMDDGVFPRTSRPHVDDLIARTPRVGDHDPRTEDRQLLLDAVASASDHLIVTWTGQEERSDEAVPPCVPVAELMRAVDQLDPDADRPLSDRLTTRHPRYAHDPAAFDPDGRPGFDRLAYRAAAATVSTEDTGPALLPPPEDDDVDLAALSRFAIDPATTFVREALGIWVPEDPEAPDENVPVELDGLEGWKVGEALLAVDPSDTEALDAVVTAARGRGLLPPPELRPGKVNTIPVMVEELRAHCEQIGVPADGSGDHVAVDVEVGRWRVHGAVHGVVGDRIVDVSYSRLTGKRLMRAWIDLLALTVQDPDRSWESVVVGRDKVQRKDVASSRRIDPLAPSADRRLELATGFLADLLQLRHDGLREPLVVPSDTAHAYARARVVDHEPPEEADNTAAKAWDPHPMGFSSDCGRPAHVLLLGDVHTYDRLTRDPARTDDQRLGMAAEPHRFGALAMRLWAPVLQRLGGQR
ncbi:exodeoxyribonuclease V subunit gamma [Euzebya rosea]|uniref:exodeoxyribonuclease V subunit gamma n=1 Tax=Euzebya rosea TaxID=2052804 RepID=UPI000D3E88B8|nr:exodeoxyribonuclease V subunit gamma [Euzebya rosea]